MAKFKIGISRDAITATGTIFGEEAFKVLDINAGNSRNHPVLGGFLRPGLHILAHLFAGLGDGNIHQIADNLIHIAADIAHFGKLCRLNLQERCFGQLGQPAADLGLAYTRGANHQDVLGIHLVPQIICQPRPPPAIAQGHSHSALGILLADNVAVQFRDDFTRGQVGHIKPLQTEGGR